MDQFTRTFFATLAVIALAACESGTSASDTPVEVTTPTVDIIDPIGVVPDPAPGDVTVSVTYYRLSRTEAPVSGWSTKTYTASGYCTQIATQTYCWDDGLKTLVAWTDLHNNHYGPFYYDYWELQNSSGVPHTCHGACANDYMSSPVLVDSSMASALPAQNVSAVFASGVPTTVTCTKVGTTVTCGNLSLTGVL